MTVYIFGGSGFVGCHLVDKLKEMKKNVVVCDIVPPSFDANYMNIDIQNKQTFANLVLEYDDIVINLAANQYHNAVPKKTRERISFLIQIH